MGTKIRCQSVDRKIAADLRALIHGRSRSPRVSSLAAKQMRLMARFFSLARLLTSLTRKPARACVAAGKEQRQRRNVSSLSDVNVMTRQLPCICRFVGFLL